MSLPLSSFAKTSVIASTAPLVAAYAVYEGTARLHH